MSKEHSDLAGISFHSTSTYSLIDEIGRGGMGIIFLAEKNNDGVKDMVVLKTIRTLSKEHEDRLKEEANVATGLRHENIVKTYGLESLPLHLLPETFRKEIDSVSEERVKRRYEPYSRIKRVLSRKPRLLTVSKQKTVHKSDKKKLFFIAMDYVEGPDLATLHHEHIRRHLLIPYELVAFIVSRICRALSYAHGYIIHRDISPENILIDSHGVCKLSDFGVAAHTKEELKLFVGKLSYMSPEQINREEIDLRSDVFALGLVAYELLTGIQLYDTPDRMSFLEKREYVMDRMENDIVPPDEIRNDVPRVLSKIVMRMLVKNRNERYQNMYDVGDVLEQKYLYSHGFGPTNNSLASYIDIFYSNFEKYDQEQLRQLSFLKGEDGKITLRRKIRPRFYTKDGIKFVMSRSACLTAQSLARQNVTI